MKTRLLFLLLFISSLSYGQNSLSMLGSNYSFAKGNIDVEVLTEIIQQKQGEVTRRVFHNLIIKSFKDANDFEASFATYHYIYNVMNSLLAEKNKTVITRQILNGVLEYAIVYAFTREFVSSEFKTSEDSIVFFTAEVKIQPEVLLGLLDIKPWQGSDGSSDGNKRRMDLKKTSNGEWKTFNILLDMALDIFLNDTTASAFSKYGLFNFLSEKSNLHTWYDRYNAYKKIATSNADSATLAGFRNKMLTAYDAFKNASVYASDLLKIRKDLEITYFKQTSLTDQQYDALKNVLRLSVKTVKPYSDNNLIGTLTEYLLDYIFVEFPATASDGVVTASAQSQSQKGIIYIDAEGLISNLYDKFSGSKKRSTIAHSAWFIAPRPFLTIGTTYGDPFRTQNALLVDDNEVSNLKNIYFASEKIGLKLTFMDKAYTHSFAPGEEFKYHGSKTFWQEPQKEPLITRIETLFYGSGLLYNVIDIKSQRNFNYALAGGALGITFFNGLMLNAGGAVPINDGELSNKWMFTFSFDIPIIEYLSAVSKRRGGR
ncbi:hypothetical protein [Parapedobacter defluvii]|uniref:hypothetical protein n=1 Tax=Parapedobacter defluvii TaxID=2045106 RepID=UPI003340561D